MSGDVRVATAQLRELAAELRHAATEIRSAVELVDGVHTSGSRMKGVAEEMADTLHASAGAHDRMQTR
jgi:methyl-accepting chemotaxis protein